jgi:AraC-like DNA-binding protein
MEVISSLFSPKEHSFKEIIDAHVFSNLSVEELAQLASLSVSSFKREFSRIYGDSPAHYLKKKKLQRAEELLLVSELRISDIAFDCGFNEVAHFSKSFKEKHGVSPTTYRLSQKGKA